MQTKKREGFEANRENTTFPSNVILVLGTGSSYVLKTLFLTYRERWDDGIHVNSDNKHPKLSNVQK